MSIFFVSHILILFLLLYIGISLNIGKGQIYIRVF